jgi:predicted Zn-dependent protease
MSCHRRFLALALLALAFVALEGCATAPPPTDMELGEQALAHGDWREARNHFAIALKKNPREGRAWLGEARAHLAGRDPEAALRSLGSLAKVDAERFKLDGRPVYADALHGAAVRRLDQKQSQAALVAVRALAEWEPDRRGLNRLLGDTLIAEGTRLRLRGQREAAYALFREAALVVPQRLDGWLAAAEIMIESNRGKDAVRLLEAARKFHPTAGEIRMLSIQALSAR